MDRLDHPPGIGLRLRCPECHDPDALDCRVIVVGEGVWVTLKSQTCACDPYADWDDVWEQARTIVKEHDDSDFDEQHRS